MPVIADKTEDLGMSKKLMWDSPLYAVIMSYCYWLIKKLVFGQWLSRI